MNLFSPPNQQTVRLLRYSFRMHGKPHVDDPKILFSPIATVYSGAIRSRDRAAQFAGQVPDLLIQALLIRYDPEAVIGWHRDRPVYEHIVGILPGEPATMRFRQRRGEGFARASMPLAPHAGYHISGTARYDWEHSIAEMD